MVVEVLMLDWVLLIVAAFFAGVLNAIAGGGSFLTFPALVFTGLAPVAANATSAVAVFPGYLGAVMGFRHELLRLERQLLRRYLIFSLVGGLAGSLLLLITSNAVFSYIVPWLLLFATLLFGCGEWLLKRLQRVSTKMSSVDLLLILLVSGYGGYFNGGLGIILLAALLFAGFTDLNVMNGLKNGISFFVSIVSVITFAIAGLVKWPEALAMMTSASLGGYLGAVIATKIPSQLLRYLITSIGVIMSGVFFYRI